MTKRFQDFIDGPYREKIMDCSAASLDEALAAAGIDLEEPDADIRPHQVMELLAVASQNTAVRTLELYHQWLLDEGLLSASD